MNTKTKRHTINANGFRVNVDFYADEIVKMPVKKTQLLRANKQLWQGIIKIQKALDAMPQELYDLVGEIIAEAGEIISDEAGKIGAAHDKKGN